MIVLLAVTAFVLIVVCFADALSGKTDEQREADYEQWIEDMKHGRR